MQQLDDKALKKFVLKIMSLEYGGVKQDSHENDQIFTLNAIQPKSTGQLTIRFANQVL